MIKTVEAWKQIEEIVKDIPGWTPLDELYTLFILSVMTKGLAGDILEVGAWCGRSSVVLGKSVQITKEKIIVYCIDPFPDKNDWKENDDGTFSFVTNVGKKIIKSYQVQTVHKEPFENDILPVYQIDDCLYNIWSKAMKNNNLEGINKSFRGDTDMFFEDFPKENKLKLVFLDGDHGYESVKQDIKNIEKHLVKGGYLCFDDAFSFYKGVDKAITECIIDSDKYDICQQMTRKLFLARKS